MKKISKEKTPDSFLIELINIFHINSIMNKKENSKRGLFLFSRINDILKCSKKGGWKNSEREFKNKIWTKTHTSGKIESIKNIWKAKKGFTLWQSNKTIIGSRFYILKTSPDRIASNYEIKLEILNGN